MRRFTSVILLILLGALAVATGMGLILKKANDDRKRLADIVLHAQEERRQAQAAQEEAVLEANQKLDSANAQITQAQQALKSLQEERDAIASAMPLTPPSPKSLRGWQQAIDLVLGVSCFFPLGNEIRENGGAALTIARTMSTTDVASPEPWLSITPYDANRESAFLNTFSTSTSVSYLVDGHVLIGRRGRTFEQSDEVVVLHVQKNGVISHTIWIKNPVGITTDNGLAIKNILSTLSFHP